MIYLRGKHLLKSSASTVLKSKRHRAALPVFGRGSRPPFHRGAQRLGSDPPFGNSAIWHWLHPAQEHFPAPARGRLSWPGSPAVDPSDIPQDFTHSSAWWRQTLEKEHVGSTKQNNLQYYYIHTYIHTYIHIYIYIHTHINMMTETIK